MKTTALWMAAFLVVVSMARAENKKKPPEAVNAAAAMLGKPFPALTFTASDGRAVDVAALTGKVVLVDFWASWCKPCQRDAPNLVATYNQFHDQGFEIVGINLDRDQAKFEKYLADNGVTWPQYFDGLGWRNKIAQKLGVHGAPASFLVDSGGIVRGANLRGPALGQALNRLLPKPPAP